MVGPGAVDSVRAPGRSCRRGGFRPANPFLSATGQTRFGRCSLLTACLFFHPLLSSLLLRPCRRARSVSPPVPPAVSIFRVIGASRIRSASASCPHLFRLPIPACFLHDFGGSGLRAGTNCRGQTCDRVLRVMAIV